MRLKFINYLSNFFTSKVCIQQDFIPLKNMNFSNQQKMGKYQVFKIKNSKYQ